MADLYNVLGIERTASLEQIKRAYRQKVRQTHPDKNRDDPNAARRFAQVQQAYEVLTDPKRRALYDQFGDAAFNGAGQSGPAGAAGQPGGPGWHGTASGPAGKWAGGWEAGGVDFSGLGIDEILDRLGFGSGRRSRQRTTATGQKVTVGSDVELDVRISFADMVRGTTKTVTLKQGGETRRVEVKIPPGITDGARLRIRGMGRPAARGMGMPGDLIIVCRVENDPRFTREGQDVVVDVDITPADAALGCLRDVPTPAGQTVQVRIPPGTSSDTRLRVRGQGISTGDGESGNLLVRVRIVLPRHLTDRQRTLYEQLRNANG